MKQNIIQNIVIAGPTASGKTKLSIDIALKVNGEIINADSMQVYKQLKKLYDVKLNSNDELYSQKKLIEMSQGCDGILSALTDKLDKETINLLPESVKILSNFAVGFGNIDLEAAKKRNITVTNTPEVLTDAKLEKEMTARIARDDELNLTIIVE